MQESLIVLVILTIAIALYLFTARQPHSASMFAAKASGALYDLGLDVRHLPDTAKKKFFREADALHAATKGKFPPKHLAMRFFTWYHTECNQPDPKAIVGDGSLIKSVIMMRQWANSDETLRTASINEMTKIVHFLYELIEQSGDDRKSRQTQRENLAKFAELNGLGKLELEKEIYGNLANAMEMFKIRAAREALHEPEYAKENISWCTGLFFYAAMRLARYVSDADYHVTHWNSLNHRMINEMLNEHRSLSYSEHVNIEMRAFQILESIDTLVDANSTPPHTGIHQFLFKQFGTQTDEARLLIGKAFADTVRECAVSYLPEFMAAFD